MSSEQRSEGVGPDAWALVKVSRELLTELAAGWSAPVQLMATPPSGGGNAWELTARDVLADSPKMLRETLCVAQARIGQVPLDEGRKREHIERLQRLIDMCDTLRPLGPDGKHDDAHQREHEQRLRDLSSS